MQLAVGRIKIVPVITDLLPASEHGTVIIEEIPEIIYPGPSNGSITVVSDIVIYITIVIIAHAEPVIDNG